MFSRKLKKEDTTESSTSKTTEEEITSTIEPERKQMDSSTKVPGIPKHEIVIDLQVDIKPLCIELEMVKSLLQNGSIDEKLDCINKIAYAAYTSNKEWSKKYDKALAQTNLFEAVVNLVKVDDFNDLLFKDKKTCDLTIAVLSCMMNVTNYYGNVGKSIAEAGGIACMTNMCKFKPFLEKLDDENVYSLMVSAVAILHNIAHKSSVPEYFKENKTAQALVPIIDAKDEQLQIYATLAAAQTSDDDEIHTFDCKGVITSILKYIKTASQNNPSHSYGGAVITELLDGMDKLACADQNKKKIIGAGALPIFLRVLKLENPEEQALVARVLWTMSFDDDVAREIKKSKDLIEKLNELSKSQERAVKNNVKGLMYNLDRLDKDKELKPGKPTQKRGNHVFISYCWKEKDIVLKLKDLLEKEGVNIWIDTEQMRGSTLQAMAEAVENAALVLICMSEHYKQSPNCRLESENTFRLRKEYIPLMVQKYYKPDGWLGALLGTKLYIDFSGKYKFEPKWNELIKELRLHKVLGGEDNCVEVEKSPVVSSSVPSPSPLTKSKLSTPADVRHWLTVNNLVKCCQHFEDVNGEGLLQLKYMRHDAPEFYFKTLSRKLKLSLGEILNLTAALEKL